mgnify:CR=1 FL=1
MAEGRPLTKVRDQNEKVEAARGKPEIFAEFRKANARKFRGFKAPESNIQCIEAAANLLTVEELDPFGKIPEFKYCAVRISRAVASIGRMRSAVPWAISVGLPLARTAATSAVKSSIHVGTTA